MDEVIILVRLLDIQQTGTEKTAFLRDVEGSEKLHTFRNEDIRNELRIWS
jgi:hypothetical protein